MNVPPEIIYGAIGALFGLLGWSYRRCERDRASLMRALIDRKNDPKK